MTTDHDDNLEQPPAGKIVETKTVYSVSGAPISRQLDMQEAAREGTPTLTDSDGNDLYPPNVCNWIVWSEERIIALERDLASATAALAEERALKDALANAVNTANVLAFERKQQLELAEAELAKVLEQLSLEKTRFNELSQTDAANFAKWIRAELLADALALAIQEWQGKADVLADQFPEINPSNYDHDDVCKLNEWGCDAFDALRALPSPSRERGEALLKELASCRQLLGKALLRLQELGDKEFVLQNGGDSAIKEGR